MNMLDLLKTKATAEQEAAWAENRKRWNDGIEAGRAGLPMPEGGEPIAYKSGIARRRVEAGEIIGFVMQSSKCGACGDQNYGWRLGCRCWPPETWLKAVPGFTMIYGAQVEAGSDPGDPACVFMHSNRIIELVRGGREILDVMTGESVAVEIVPAPLRAVQGAVC